ncbi:2-hydroxyacyl-CoA dehydratase, partial [Chloroflexota bacterium]
KVDGVIAHTVLSCRSVTIGNRHMSKLLREQMGLPVLDIESHMSDQRSYSKDEVRGRIDAFLDMLEGR